MDAHIKFVKALRRVFPRTVANHLNFVVGSAGRLDSSECR